MLKYTLCLIKQGSKILLLNREKPAWMGCWNGVGGKIEKNEQPRASMLREIREETGIEALDLTFKGLITWTTGERRDFGGLYLYLADIPQEYTYPTPVKSGRNTGLERNRMDNASRQRRSGLQYSELSRSGAA
ncbi:NUDIX hydrolase [Paenibacillus dendritiformis]|uniref:NUDIX hydrolase n=1 Tax=Paenibacillus dendritiformis TaxID=130049 RepID=UPI001F553533|nr:8-oxo-dGTP diphosphatase [Paenibacillus dendritiformis]